MFIAAFTLIAPCENKASGESTGFVIPWDPRPPAETADPNCCIKNVSSSQVSTQKLSSTDQSSIRQDIRRHYHVAIKLIGKPCSSEISNANTCQKKKTTNSTQRPQR